MKLTCTDTGHFTLHPDGIHPAICIDVIDRGRQPNFAGDGTRETVMLVFETEQKDDEGTPMTLSRTFGATLHPKSSLNKFLGQWRGKPLAEGEELDLDRLLGKCLTLVVSHQPGQDGNMRAKIETCSKATRIIKSAGTYDGDALREKLAERDRKRNTPSADAGRDGLLPKRPAPEPAPSRGRISAEDVPKPAPKADPTEDDDVPF